MLVIIVPELNIPVCFPSGLVASPSDRTVAFYIRSGLLSFFYRFFLLPLFLYQMNYSIKLRFASRSDQCVRYVVFCH